MRREIIVYIISLLITAFAAIFFQIVGYPPVVTASATLDRIAPPIYMIPIFFPFGILIGEFIWNWIKKENRNNSILYFIECMVIAGLGFFRYVLGIPYSGHTLILSYYLMHQFIDNKSNYPIRIIIGILVLLITIIYKLIIWNDPITFYLGLILGFIIWIPGFLLRLKFFKI